MNRIFSACVAVSLITIAAAPVSAVTKARKPYADTTQPVPAPPDGTGKTDFDGAAKASDAFKLAEGLSVEPFAVEPQLCNPVAMHVDDQGRFWVVETFRFDDGTPYRGVFDIRHRYDNLDEDLACRTVEDRLAEAKHWMNGDLGKLSASPDRIRRIEDTNGDGRADRSTIFATFNDPMSGLAAGVTTRGSDVYVTDIPDLWLLHDKKNTGVADSREKLSTGYGVHYSLLGHDLHAPIWGPDGRLYFSNGDRGQHVKTKEGKIIDLPDCGAVLRCDPDGSNLEVFAMGLRNPQGLSFDKYGNLFTGDNNADYGELARWAYIVEGGDTGWRIGYQHLKTPKPGGPWIAEDLWQTQDKNTAEYLIPPVGHVGSGPSGNAYYPGTGLSPKYNDHFFQTDFAAGPRSQVHSFALKARGAGFEVVDHDTFIQGPLTSDVQFGIDGGVYVLDWAGNGYQKASRGRIWHVFDSDTVKSPAVLEVKQLIKTGMAARPLPELAKLLGHTDMRVRQAAQFELAHRESKAVPILLETLHGDANQMARIHALWALGQIARTSKDHRLLEAALPLLDDKDPEIRAQAAHALGDAGITKAAAPLVKLLADANARVRFFAAISLGKVGSADAVPPILTMLTAAEDKDPFLRHAGVMGLSGIASRNMLALIPANNFPSLGARMGVLLALRHLQRPEVANFLTTTEPRLVLEAARAIDDAPINGAMPELAKMIARADIAKLPDFLVLRVLNANFRLGGEKNASAVATYAANNAAPELLRQEAFAMLTQWSDPRGVDRVVGIWRPLSKRDPSIVAKAAKPILSQILLNPAPDTVKIAAIDLLKKIGSAEPDLLAKVVAAESTPATVSASALAAMDSMNDPKTDAAVEASLQRTGLLREQAIRLLARHPDGSARLEKLLASGSLADQQAVFAALGAIDGNATAEKVIAQWMDKLSANPPTIRPELVLDLLEAAGKSKSEAVKAKLKTYNDARAAVKNDPIASYREALAGGDAAIGKKIFLERADVSCIRCHKLAGQGGVAGPDLTGVSSRHDRAYLLRSVVDPNGDIAPGFESVAVQMKGGHHYAGIVKTDNAAELVLDAADGAIIHIDKKEIASQSKAPSGMPDNISQPLSKRDLRNLVEFLAQQKLPATTQTATTK